MANFWLPSDEGFEGATYARDEWDYVTLNGIKVPGVSDVKCEASLQIDRQKANGRDGATIIIRGHNPAPIEVVTTLWTNDQWQEYQKILQRFWRKPGKDLSTDQKDSALVKQGAIDIGHPKLERLGVSSAILVAVVAAEDGSIQGTKVARMKFLQYIATTKKSATRKAQGSNRATLAPQFADPKNAGRVKPSDSDAGPGGPPGKPAGGV